jgi:TRAP-type C4-dicarboxylate transport system substrate-binding protein
MILRLGVLAAVLWSQAAHAEGQVTLRMAAIAPEGSAWAREMHALARDVEAQTEGRVRMKWYLGGIAGDELASLERVRKKQLDGLAGAILCQRLAPSMWVTRVAGLVHDREHQSRVLNRMWPQIEREFDQQGMVALGVAPFGTDIVFTREPVRSIGDLKKQRLWVYDLDDVLTRQLPAMGLTVVPMPLEKAGGAFDDNKIDGFIALPTSTLAYQWISRLHYFTELPVAFLPGCLTVSHASFDAIGIDDQKAVRAAAAKFVVRFIDVGVRTDQQLVTGLFEKQGVKHLAPSPALFEEFLKLARAADGAIGEKLVPKSLLADVARWLSER